VKRFTSEDFEVGQQVVCVDPDKFLQPRRNYLRDRVGTVIKVYPAERPGPQYCGWTNCVSVLWGKRNGRGKEQEILMRPRDITLVGDSK
jgi:hypothetical protein